MLDSIQILRNQIQSKSFNVCSKTGCYRLWCDSIGTSLILEPLMHDLDFSKISKKVICGRDYYALYFGISKDLRDRIKWHICQKHSASAVKSGALSTLRQSISALLGVNMTAAQVDVNTYLDDHCWLEYDYCSSFAGAEQKEKAELANGYYPLNIQNNKAVPKQATQKLSKLRQQFKK